MTQIVIITTRKHKYFNKFFKILSDWSAEKNALKDRLDGYKKLIDKYVIFLKNKSIEIILIKFKESKIRYLLHLDLSIKYKIVLF